MQKHHALGILAGIIVLVALMVPIPETRCVDGWNSPSIGKQGACSHHGGVDHTSTLLMILALGLSAWVGYRVTKKTEGRFSEPDIAPKLVLAWNRMPEYKQDTLVYFVLGLIFTGMAIGVMALKNVGLGALSIGVIYFVVSIVTWLKKKP